MLNAKKSIVSENRRLKKQLEISQHEIVLIKQSRAYRAIRLLGHAKNQLKQSPAGFSKKVVKKLLSRGGLQSAGYINKNLASIDKLQDQYQNWIAFNEPDELELENQKSQSDKFESKPLISIITPVFNPPVDVLKQLIDSVLEQTYPHFELCLGNFGDDTAVAELIAEYNIKDGRVMDWAFTENKGIAANSNSILAKAKGEYIALLDHDDTLSPDALFENVKLLNEADYDFIYSDKDKIDEQGNRFEPFFKPGWSPEIMLNANYLTHLNVMKTSIVRRVGGWSSDTDGAQDWDIFLKVITNSKLIGHIPKVLYHWRVISTSTAHSIETKPYALQGQRNAVDKYLASKKIPATTYHEGAELLLNWKENSEKTILTVRATSYTNLASWLNSFDAESDQRASRLEWVIYYDFDLPEKLTLGRNNFKFINYKSGGFFAELKQLVRQHPKSNILLASDLVSASALNPDLTHQLSGWLSIDGVFAVGPRVTEYGSKTAIDCGAIITNEGILPIFVESPPYHQTPIGNIEWVRDLKVVSALVFMAKAESIAAALTRLGEIDDEFINTAIQLDLSSKGRLVFDPKVIVELRGNVLFNPYDYYEVASSELAKLLPPEDIYANPNLSSANPLDIAAIAQATPDEEMLIAPTPYQEEALIHAIATSLTEKDLEAHHKHILAAHSRNLTNPQSVLFILPGFQAIYAGLNNIFSYAEFLRSKGLHVSFGLILEDKDLPSHKKVMRHKFPQLVESSEFYAVTPNNIDKLPPNDIAICTQWATAYLLVKYNKTKRKCYFIQDKETSFYPNGTISALVENTYRFGLYGLANTPGLLEWYKDEYDGGGVVIKSLVDLSAYAPSARYKVLPKKPYKVFFYARPNEPRNAFELGAAALIKLKAKLKDDVEIYTAGAVWDPAVFGLEDVLTNLGKIAYDRLPNFYRSMDAGIMFMFSGHPGVVASELMASGTPVVVNEYNDKTWREIYQNETTCLVSYPTAAAIAADIERVLTDDALRKTIISNALKKVNGFYGDYQKSCEHSAEVLKGKLN